MDTECKREATAESIQTQAGVKIFKLNGKTNGFAIRATSLELRRKRAILKYYVKLLSMPLDRTTRTVAFTPRPKKARRGLGGKEAYSHWFPRTKKMLKAPELRDPLQRIKQCLRRNGGILPTGLDGTLPNMDGYLWYQPIRQWGEDVTEYIQKEELKAARSAGTRRSSTLDVILRSCVQEECFQKFPLTTRSDSDAYTRRHKWVKRHLEPIQRF